MKVRIVVVSLIALPIGSIIAGALILRHATPVRPAAPAAMSPPDGQVRDPATAGAKISGRDPVAVRVVSRRPAAPIRLVPLAQSDDARQFR